MGSVACTSKPNKINKDEYPRNTFESESNDEMIIKQDDESVNYDNHKGEADRSIWLMDFKEAIDTSVETDQYEFGSVHIKHKHTDNLLSNVIAFENKSDVILSDNVCSNVMEMAKEMETTTDFHTPKVNGYVESEESMPSWPVVDEYEFILRYVDNVSLTFIPDDIKRLIHTIYQNMDVECYVNKVLRPRLRADLYETFVGSKVKFYRKCTRFGITDEMIDIITEHFYNDEYLKLIP